MVISRSTFKHLALAGITLLLISQCSLLSDEDQPGEIVISVELAPRRANIAFGDTLRLQVTVLGEGGVPM